jgi:hypothetical protein
MQGQDTPSDLQRKELHSPVVTLLIAIAIFSILFTGAEFNDELVSPLHFLKIIYPKILSYLFLIIPGAIALLWFTLGRWKPQVALIAIAVVCISGFLTDYWYANYRVARLPAMRFLTQEEKQRIDGKLALPILERLSGAGYQILVARENKDALVKELAGTGVLR